MIKAEVLVCSVFKSEVRFHSQAPDEFRNLTKVSRAIYVPRWYFVATIFNYHEWSQITEYTFEPCFLSGKLLKTCVLVMSVQITQLHQVLNPGSWQTTVQVQRALLRCKPTGQGTDRGQFLQKFPPPIPPWKITPLKKLFSKKCGHFTRENTDPHIPHHHLPQENISPNGSWASEPIVSHR